MKFRTLLACLALVFGCASDSLAQFTPVVAKIKIRYYRTQSDGTEKVTKVREGFYHRSSSGDGMKTDFAVNENGKRREPGKSMYVNASTGKIYSLDHNFRKGMLEQKLTSPLAPIRPSDIDDPNYVLGKEMINGLRCIVTPMKDSDGNITGKVWRALDVDDLMVKMEHRFSNGRYVWELYDIQFTEPDRSKFGFPSDYTIDQSKCMGCEENKEP